VRSLVERSHYRDDATRALDRDIAGMRGSTLFEYALALAIAGILAGFAVPRAATLRDRLLVDHHVQQVRTGYQRARLAALLGSGTAILRIDPSRVAVWTTRGGDSTLVWQARGAADDGVSLAGPTRTVFAPAGITLGVANGTYVLARGGVSRTVVVSRLGRLRVVPRRRRIPGRRGP
jgi:Tfp pilus assembly protein FimT